MANHAGALAQRFLQGTPAGMSGDLAKYTAVFLVAAAFTSAPIAGTKGSNTSGIAARQAAHSGALARMFGDELFEKVIVIPRTKDVGFVLSEVQFPVEVWNAFRRLPKTVTAITVSGGGGLSITNPFGLPLTLGPFGSKMMTAIVPQDGPPAINNQAIFVVTGISGTDLVVTGSRLVTYAVDIDWENGFEETPGWLTDVMDGYDEGEQRVQLITDDPRFSCKFRSLTLSAQESAQLMSKIWSWQSRVFGVPWWKDQAELTSPAAIGASSISCDTTLRPGLVAGNLLLVWRDNNTWEALQIYSVTPTAINLVSATQKAWATGDIVVPVRLARLAGTPTLIVPNRDCYIYEASFRGELPSASAAPAAAAPTAYRGFDVLTLEPNVRDDGQVVYGRSMATLDAVAGAIEVNSRSRQPRGVWSYNWFMDSRTGADEYDAFMLARAGRAVPFWVPSWRGDLELATLIGSGDTTITIKACDYTAQMFPAAGRRHLAVMLNQGATLLFREILSAIDNGNGTETLTIDAALGAAGALATTTLSFLLFCRLDSDEPPRLWHHTQLAEATLPLRELPLEAPVTS
jgi:hypothetical protein